ncbi:regulator of nonsense transcripts, putative [Babesia bigemina]|uniref:Regulator of nonsense transcripts, putative n=1 Tax=Babesia bigemina TaxID=5866 RepID=A0A061DDN7_BABBI|nr:regulator of nonsense transcripts, putative [Babesia bigemina]CDR96420.1 regulator of nonsense transcripts, putative [Babesia bigemina]|eukprot:XP_012768606.1 regulator of nonsense transcripts, putative [Babesia bigemina]
MARPSKAKSVFSDNADLPSQKKRITTAATSADMGPSGSASLYKLEQMAAGFGKIPEFNKLMYNDDNVLMTLNVQLKNTRYKANMDVFMDKSAAVCKYDISVNGGEKITGTTTATNKKAARKNAARCMLMHMDKPTVEEIEEITKWMVAGHRNNIGAREEPVSKEFGPLGHTVTLRWRCDDHSFYGKGVSNSLKLAELYAMQDLYCQTHKFPTLQQEAKVLRPVKLNATPTITKASAKASRPEPIIDELSKADVCHMNTLRNSMVNKMKVKQHEVITQSRGGFLCTLTWEWLDTNGQVEKRTVAKQGTSKALAKAAASKAILVEVGVIDPVTREESSHASSIRSSITKNIARAVQAATEFVRKTNCSVWRLFMPQLVEALVQRGDRELVTPLLESITAADVEIPTDIWETLLSLSSIAVDEMFCKAILHGIKHLTLDSRYFISEKAQKVYQKQSWLLALEFNAEMCSNLASLQSRGGKDVVSLLCDNTKSQLPLMFLKGTVNSEYSKSPLREDDMVLLVPYNGVYQWGDGLVAIVSKHKSENYEASLTCKVVNRLKWDPTDAIYEHNRFGVFFVNNTTTNKRMMQALLAITHKMLPVNSNAQGYHYNKDLQRILIESDKDSVADLELNNAALPTSIPLTPSQSDACKSALTNPLTLIQGPPGTGKTQVACAIIDCWRQQTKEKILAVADSNVAADNLIEGLNSRGIHALRIGFGSESLLQEESLKRLAKYGRYKSLKESGYYKEANSLRMAMITEAIRQHQVIIATCVGSGNDILSSYSFPYVVIDECAQSIEASNLIPIGKGCKQLVLIGDHKQLRPTIISPEAAAQGLSISLLERLVSAQVATVHVLDVQRRMHPSISEFPNKHFYRGAVRDAVSESSRPPVRGFKWPTRGYNIAFIDASAGCPNSQFESNVGTSKANALEADIVAIVLKSIIEARDVRESQIGILTAYDAQKWMLKRKLNQIDSVKGQAIEIDSVDGFQGKEKELIIFSAVRSNLQKDVGFLRDPRRMNVMLTRARRGLIVIADKYTIMNDIANWRPYVEYITDRVLDIHISELNMFLDSPSNRLDGIVRQVRTGWYP